MELPVGVFIGLLDPLHILDDVQGGDEVDVQLGGVSHQAQDGVGLADAGVDGDALFLEPGDEAVQLVPVGVVLQNDNHGGFLLMKICFQGNAKRPAAGLAAGRFIHWVLHQGRKLTHARFQPNHEKPYQSW